VVSRGAEYDKLVEHICSSRDMGLVYKALESQGWGADWPL
jgi:hypothetical protein